MTAKAKTPADNLAKTIAELERMSRRHTTDANSAALDVIHLAYRRLIEIQKRMEARQ